MDVLLESLNLVFSFDPDLYEIIWLSLKVSLFALTFSCFLGLPIAGVLSSTNFTGKKTIIIFFNSMMALPPVFVGLLLYILFSQTGPLGFLDILYTPSIMIIAQIIIILPIIASLPALDSVITPFISSPSKIGAQKARCSIGLTPAFKTRLSATTLNPSLSSS